MNDILKFLSSHTSVRAFTGKEITEAEERTIVESAERAPTSSNLHAYSIVTVRNTAIKDRLAELCGNQAHVAASSVFMVFCADMYRLGRLSEQRGYDYNGDTTEALLVAVVDAALAAERALQAAQALGYGGVMVGGIRNQPQEVCDLLALPERVFPVMGMSLGEPKGEAKVKPRLPLDGLWFRERYQPDKIDPAVAEYDATIDQLGYLTKRQVEPERYTEFRGTYAWAEHSARRMASDAPGVVRLHMKSFLESRGLLKR